MRSLSTIILFLTLTGFVMPNHKEHNYLSKAEQLVNSTLAKAAGSVKKKYNIDPSGEGAAMPGGPIKKLTLCFDTKDILTKNDLRKLLIHSSQELLDQINANQDIQQFLIKQPFTIKDVQIIIYNHNKEGRGAYDPEILTAEISQGCLTYRTIESRSCFKLKNQFEESYEEALKAMAQ
jgi:hypothetical protein